MGWEEEEEEDRWDGNIGEEEGLGRKEEIDWEMGKERNRSEGRRTEEERKGWKIRRKRRV